MRYIVTALVALALASSAWADFDDGMAAVERGDYATALREFWPLAEQGDAVAQYNLGLMHENAYGVPQHLSVCTISSSSFEALLWAPLKILLFRASSI